MPTSRTQLLAAITLAGCSTVAAAQPICEYGDGTYTTGALLCQAGLRMQCQAGDDGQARWVSLDQLCTEPPLSRKTTAPAPATATGGEMSAPAASTSGAAMGGEPAAASEQAPAAAPAPAPTPAAEPTVGPGWTIDVMWAHYGRDGVRCDAEPALTTQCGGHTACDVTASPSTLCGDPVPGKPKLLTVYWRCTDGRSYVLQEPLYVQEGNGARMECGG